MSNIKKPRIGILTIHAAINYGSMLQAYALQHQLEETAGEAQVELIDYLPGCIMDQYSLNPLRNLGSLRAFARYCVDLPGRITRTRVFGSFARDLFHLSQRAYTSAAALERDRGNWDMCVLGSDQVWNPEIVSHDPTFWLEFAQDAFRGSYASSFGTTNIPSDYRDRLAAALRGFDCIAVREPSAAEMLRDVGRPITVTCDPVFLLSADQWAALERKPENVPDHYILYYTVERNRHLEDLVRAASAHYGIPVVDLGVRTNPREYFGVHSPAYGPREFLYLIHHADYMATNSFHGTAFGTIFGKKCVSLLHRTRGTRIRELAQLADRSRFILGGDASLEDMICCFDTDRKEDPTGLACRIEASKAYLKEMLTRFRAGRTGDE